MEDLQDVDAYSHQVLKDIEAHGKKLKSNKPELLEEFDAIVDETFETFLSNGQKVEICDGGKDIVLTHKNWTEYQNLVVKTRLNETKKQMDWVREGFSFVLDINLL